MDKKYKNIIRRLLISMELWASEEDGIPDFEYKKFGVNPYRVYMDAKTKLGIDEETTVISHDKED